MTHRESRSRWGVGPSFRHSKSGIVVDSEDEDSDGATDDEMSAAIRAILIQLKA